MTTTDFSTTLLVDQTPEEVFAAINQVRGWWSEEIEGGTDQLHDVFRYHYKEVHRCTIQITEVVPGKNVVWRVLDNYFDFMKDQNEWKDTEIVFDIAKQEGRTRIRFTHRGLIPEYECYKVCSNAWTKYIQQSLRDLITTGKGQPNIKSDPSTVN